MSDLVARCPSSRHKDVVYEVRLEDGLYRCDCPGFHRWKHCRHASALEALKALPFTQLKQEAQGDALRTPGAPWEL